MDGCTEPQKGKGKVSMEGAPPVTGGHSGSHVSGHHHTTKTKDGPKNAPQSDGIGKGGKK